MVVYCLGWLNFQQFNSSLAYLRIPLIDIREEVIFWHFTGMLFLSSNYVINVYIVINTPKYVQIFYKVLLFLVVWFLIRKKALIGIWSIHFERNTWSYHCSYLISLRAFRRCLKRIFINLDSFSIGLGFIL